MSCSFSLSLLYTTFQDGDDSAALYPSTIDAILDRDPIIHCIIRLHVYYVFYAVQSYLQKGGYRFAKVYEISTRGQTFKIYRIILTDTETK